MPEGDTVWLAARRLDRALTGQPLTRTDFRVPSLATVDLSGQRVLGVVSRGKHLLTRFSDDLTLHTHFRMDGSWHLYAPGERWRGGPQHEVRVILEVADAVAVGYRLPVVELLPTAEEHRVVGHLGPDLLGGAWGDAQLTEAVRRLRQEPAGPIKDALLDQTKLAGLGNLYANELCFLRGISPWALVPAVDRGDALDRLVLLGRKLLQANRETAAQVTTGDRRRGHQHWVYDRAGRPCRRCGTPIRTAPQGQPGHERQTYWCPTCQPT